MNRPSAPDVAAVIARVYARPGGGAGCCLHLVTEDGNVDDGSVAYCQSEAAEAGHADCEEALGLLAQMKRTGRWRASQLAYRLERDRLGL